MPFYKGRERLHPIFTNIYITLCYAIDFTFYLYNKELTNF